MNRKQQQAELLAKLGALMGPLLKMANSPDQYSAEEQRRIMARFFSEDQQFIQELTAFTRGESGHVYAAEHHQAHMALVSVTGVASHKPHDKEALYTQIKKAYGDALEAIQSIPVPVEGSLHEATSPFSTFCLVKDLCATAKERVIWVDRYMDGNLFYRFLRDVPPHIDVTLVTWPDHKHTSSSDKQRFSNFMDVSGLYANERGPDRYRLVVNEAIHDRWLCCDQDLFALGGSIKDLGKEAVFTISKVSSVE